MILSWWDKAKSGTGTTRERERARETPPNGQSIVLWRADTLHPPSSSITQHLIHYSTRHLTISQLHLPPSAALSIIVADLLLDHPSRRGRNETTKSGSRTHPPFHPFQPSIHPRSLFRRVVRTNLLARYSSTFSAASALVFHPRTTRKRPKNHSLPRSLSLRGATRPLVSGALGFNTGIHRVGESVI